MMESPRTSARRIEPNESFYAEAADVFLHGLLGPRRTGTCASLPVLYAAVGRRLGYPLKLVLILTFVAFFGISVTGCDKPKADPVSTSISAESLFDSISRVEPWRSTKDYTSNDWKNAIETARMFQNASPSTVELVLQRFAETEPGAVKGGFVEMSKPLLILRIAFDLPESATNNPSASVMTWESGGGEINADGSFNVAWPIRWNNGRPILIQRFSGLSGPAYTVLGDYHIFRARYPFRELPRKIPNQNQ